MVLHRAKEWFDLGLEMMLFIIGIFIAYWVVTVGIFSGMFLAGVLVTIIAALAFG